MRNRWGGNEESFEGWKSASLALAIAAMLFMTAPVPVHAVGQRLPEDDPGPTSIPIDCSHAVMTTAPTFLKYPRGAAKYPFSMKCTSPSTPGVMIFSWEGGWNPSETRRDRPNASESLTITGFEPFLPDRVVPGQPPGGKIFMYWTGSCTADPWLQDGTCSRFGEYMPDDLKVRFPNIGARPFPLTGRRISPTLKQQLIKQYQAANQPASSSRARKAWGLSLRLSLRNLHSLRLPRPWASSRRHLWLNRMRHLPISPERAFS